MFYSTTKGFLSLDTTEISKLRALSFVCQENRVSLQFFMLQNRAYWEVHLCTSKESGGQYEVGAVELDI